MYITIKEHVYAGKRRHVGDKYEPRTGQDLRLALALRWLKKYEEPVVVKQTIHARTNLYDTMAIQKAPEIKAGIFESIKRRRGRPRSVKAEF
jgi:hypothetical protein